MLRMNRPVPTTKPKSTPPRMISRRHVRQKPRVGVADWSKDLSMIKSWYAASNLQVSPQCATARLDWAGGGAPRQPNTSQGEREPRW